MMASRGSASPAMVVVWYPDRCRVPLGLPTGGTLPKLGCASPVEMGLGAGGGASARCELVTFV